MRRTIKFRSGAALVFGICFIGLFACSGLLEADENAADSAASAEAAPESKLANKAGDRKTIVVNGVEFAFRWAPAGTFSMGAPKTEEGRFDDEIPHQVTLTKGFWIMETEVTQKQWKAVMGNDPARFQGDNNPVECVSWDDCQEFCKKCSQSGAKLELPTEAQWEYACRAGSVEAYPGDLEQTTWYEGNCGSKTHPVGTKKPNAWGLYDMTGNAWEWCADWYGEYPNESVTDPTGPQKGSFKLFRGGGWHESARYCRCAVRGYSEPDYQDGNFGFRCIIKE